MNKWLKLLLGLVFLAGSVFAWGNNLAGFGAAAETMLKGGIIWTVLIAGTVMVFLGMNDLKN